MTIGWDLALPIFLGVLGGHLLDRRWRTGVAFTIGLLVLGLVVGVYNLARTLQRELRRDHVDLVGPANVRTWERVQEPQEEDAHYLSNRD